MAEQPKDHAAAVKEQLAKNEEQRKKIVDEAVQRTEKAKPTPTQEENDRARLGDDVAEKADDGSGPEPRFVMTRAEEKHTEARPAAAGYQTRQQKPANQ